MMVNIVYDGGIDMSLDIKLTDLAKKYGADNTGAGFRNAKKKPRDLDFEPFISEEDARNFRREAQTTIEQHQGK